MDFQIDVLIAIGSPKKKHNFDLVSIDQRYVGECKNYSWRKSGGPPHGKISSVNEAVLYLLHLPKGSHRFVVMRRDTHPRRSDTLENITIALTVTCLRMCLS